MRRSEALRLALEGQTYEQIAQQLGYAHRGSAYRAVSQAIAETKVISEDGLRLELLRLDQLQYELWPDALAGNRRAMEGVLRIMEVRSRWVGRGSSPRRQGRMPP